MEAQEYFLYFKPSNRSIGAKDPPKPAVPTQQCCLKSRIGMIGFGFVR